ncbi:DUF4232 domain-containing protein [Saccharopolyspora sp. MS10]|uniref:DUF4232 domain-containing protein n=1 Tax=Saccharopolyspora sp. MS10 TaxID=3385973 RepID=UPI0039A05F48
MRPMFHGKRTKIATTAGIAATAGSALLAGIALAGSAQAMPSDHPDFDQRCTPDQVEVTIGPLDHAMMHEGGDVRFTAKPGQSCLLGGSPTMSFLDSRGQPLDIPGEHPRGDAETHRIDESHPASASFRYQVTDPNTGDSIPGATPSAVEIAFPGISGVYSVTVPWNGATVPGPVSISNVAPAPQA